jgi:6-phosphogluconolactonase
MSYCAKLRLCIGLILVVLIVAFLITEPDKSSAKNLKSGSVFVMTNQVTNAIAAFERDSDGSLNPAGTFLTGGSGNPVAQPGDPPTDPLASQGSLILSEKNDLLFAVNAGSNEISVLAVRPHGLELVDKVSSGGVRPISLTISGGLLYVLNEGGTPNITGFSVGKNGHLTPLPGSSRPLRGGAAADPAQVGFNNDRSLLVVTEKMSNLIDTYTVGANGLATGPISNPSAGLTPFGFAFDSENSLVVSEAFGGVPGQAAASSYGVESNTLAVVSPSIHNNQTASCWTVITNRDNYAYISNTGSGTITSYQVGPSGSLTLLQAVAANTGAMSFPIDEAFGKDGRFLYVIVAGTQSVAAYSIQNNGSLSLIGTVGGLPFGSQGIAAR